MQTSHRTDAAVFGFHPEATGLENAAALQRAVDQGGTIVIGRPGIYAMAATVYLGSHTALHFGHGVFLKKVDEQGPFSQVLLNKGALKHTWDECITVDGLHLIVNGMDVLTHEVFGLRGQIAFFYVKDLRIKRFRCHDLGKMQYCIHVCTFEDLLIDDVIISGNKDGVHLGRGRRFAIRNGVFKTFDDAIGLNAHDYDTGNPELGWIENGLVENCHDLNQENTTGFFCRILGGGWIDWRAGMEVQKSDTVVCNGRLYRVRADPDGRVFRSLTAPKHERGAEVADGITWQVVQNDVVYTAGVRNVVFRDIFLEKPRTAFSIHFDNDRYSRSYYPGAPVPQQQHLMFENVCVLHDQATPFLSINTPIDVVTVSRSKFMNNPIVFRGNGAMADYLKTRVNLTACVFARSGPLQLLSNSVARKRIELRTSSSVQLHDDFVASVSCGPGTITVDSDLPGLRQ